MRHRCLSYWPMVTSAACALRAASWFAVTDVPFVCMPSAPDCRKAQSRTAAGSATAAPARRIRILRLCCRARSLWDLSAELAWSTPPPWPCSGFFTYFISRFDCLFINSQFWGFSVDVELRWSLTFTRSCKRIRVSPHGRRHRRPLKMARCCDVMSEPDSPMETQSLLDLRMI